MLMKPFERLLGRQPVLAAATPVDRLQQLKKAVAADRKTLSDPPPFATTDDLSALGMPVTKPASPSPAPEAPSSPPAVAEIDYTNRLLQAKKQALRDRKQG